MGGMGRSVEEIPKLVIPPSRREASGTCAARLARRRCVTRVPSSENKAKYGNESQEARRRPSTARRGTGGMKDGRRFFHVVGNRPKAKQGTRIQKKKKNARNFLLWGRKEILVCDWS